MLENDNYALLYYKNDKYALLYCTFKKKTVSLIVFDVVNVTKSLCISTENEEKMKVLTPNVKK